MSSSIRNTVFRKYKWLGNLDIGSSQQLVSACFLVPIFFGFYSVWLGADTNYDLYNYHLYNPFAWLNGKLEIDLAPAGMQSYFNPLLDTFFYLLNAHLPSRVVGFVMGALHGTTFVLIAGIARHVLSNLDDADRYRVPALIALAGCLTANFLSGLGNSMGDDTTAILVLGGLLLVISRWSYAGECSVRGVMVLLGSGVLVGLGVGLKLTNAIYALALCGSLLSYPGNLLVRIRTSGLFGVGVVLGTATTGGYWMLHMWQVFGNPLYPQFGSIFHNPLTQPNAASDVRWLPQNLIEMIFWPFIFAANSHRVGETAIRQIIWPIVYVAFWCWLVHMAVSWIRGQVREPMDVKQRFIVLFGVLAYVLWMKAFSIYRYIVAVEVLTPLILMIILHRLLSARFARYAACGLIGLATVVVVTGGARTWGHEAWSDPLYHADVPVLGQPGRTTAIIAGGTTPWGWLATLFGPDVAFVQLESSFPATDAFGDLIRNRVRQRGGPAFGIVNGTYNWRADNVASMSSLITRVGLANSERGCFAVDWVVTRLRLHATVLPSTDQKSKCSLGLRKDDEQDVEAANRALAADASAAFERNGFALDQDSCVPYRAGIGKGVLVYQWCRVALR